MTSHYELFCDEQGRISFRLLDDSGDLLLQGMPCRGKIDAQAEIMRARKALRSPTGLVPRTTMSGAHIAVLEREDGNTIGRSRRVATGTELDGLIQQIRAAGVDATIIDQTRRVARR